FEYNLRPYRMERGQRAAAIADALERHLGHVDADAERIRSSDPFTLSGGQKRRLAMALVSCTEPQWLLLDEPTAGMDNEGIAAPRSWLTAPRSAGSGAIVTTHDPEKLWDIADHVVLMQGGRFVWSGPPEALQAQPDVFAAAGMAKPERLRTIALL